MHFQHQGSLIFPLIPFKCCLVLWSFFQCISVVSSQSCFRCLNRVGHSAMHHPGGLGFAAHCALSELMTISPRRLIFGTIPRFCRCRRHISPTCCFWKVPYSLLITWCSCLLNPLFLISEDSLDSLGNLVLSLNAPLSPVISWGLCWSHQAITGTKIPKLSEVCEDGSVQMRLLRRKKHKPNVARKKYISECYYLLSWSSCLQGISASSLFVHVSISPWPWRHNQGCGIHTGNVIAGVVGKKGHLVAETFTKL